MVVVVGVDQGYWRGCYFGSLCQRQKLGVFSGAGERDGVEEERLQVALVSHSTCPHTVTDRG